jgi:4a-hydroxytetrahydrobiopterin dehydratase
MELAAKKCVPCRGGVPRLSLAEAQGLLAGTPGWSLNEQATHVERTFKFEDFAGALAFVDRVGALAEAEDHHPDITFGWGYCRVVFQTHKIRGLHENDFIMAAKVNQLGPPAEKS